MTPPIGSCGPIVPGLPGHFTRARPDVRDTREHEEKVGQAVEIDDHKRWNLHLALQPYDSPLGSAADRAGDMEDSAFAAATGKDESLERLELPLAVIDRVLEVLDSTLVDVRLAQLAVHLLEIRCGQKSADAEEIALHWNQDLVDARQRLDRARHPDDRVKLVDVAVRLDARVILRNAAAAEQAGVAGIPGFCVDLHPEEIYVDRSTSDHHPSIMSDAPP